jgi:hypothetical protein
MAVDTSDGRDAGGLAHDEGITGETVFWRDSKR